MPRCASAAAVSRRRSRRSSGSAADSSSAETFRAAQRRISEMTFRPPLHKRWRYPFLLWFAAAGIWVGVFLLQHYSRHGTRLALSLILLSGVAFVDLVRRSWLIWTT